jgi:hypothetical protein
MNNLVLTQSDKCIFNLNHDFLNLFFREFALVVLSNVTGQICMFAMLKYKIKVSGSLFGVNELNDIFMFDD